MMESETHLESLRFYETVKHFPPVINGRINIINFLGATSDLVTLVERLGKVFAPVKYDIQGNIDKIRKYYTFDENSCLLEMMLSENTKEKSGIESVVWLNRALLFIELTFQEWLACLQASDLDISTKTLFTVAYEGSVKKYHNWFICKMAPTVPQILKSLEADGNIKGFEESIASYNIKLHLIRCTIDDFVKENNLFDISST